MYPFVIGTILYNRLQQLIEKQNINGLLIIIMFVSFIFGVLWVVSFFIFVLFQL